MAANVELQRVNEWAYLRGFTNLFRKESRAWWGTRRWWINALLWTGMLAGLVGLMLFMLPPLATATGDPNVAAAGGPLAFGLEMGRTAFFELGTLAIAIGVIILCQDLIVDEKQTGLTEWLLAKPVQRRAYLLAKLSASLAAILLLLIALPSVAAYSLLTLRSGELFPLQPFLAGVAVLIVHSLFYLTLTLMLGAFFTSRPPILGIALGFLLGGSMLAGLFEPLLYVTPWMLAKVAGLVAGSQPAHPEMIWPPLGSTLLWCLVFITLALAKFEETEF